MLAFVLSPSLLVSQSVPPLPKLPIDTYTAEIREEVSAAYKAATENPNDPDKSGRLGMILYANEQYEFAEPCFQRAHVLGSKDGRWVYYLGRTQANLGKHNAAVVSLREALKGSPGYLPAQEKLGECLLETGEADESLKVFRDILEKNPSDAAAHYGMGRVLVSKHQTAEAIEHLVKACELFPRFGAAHFALARAFRDSGDLDKAQEQLSLYQKDRLAWPLTPDPMLSELLDLKTGASAHLRKGIDLAEAGQLKAAAKEHELALAGDPTLVQAHIHLIRIYGMLGDPGKAESNYRAAVQLDPNLVESYYNYGVLLLGQQKYEDAMAAFRRAIAVNPSHADSQNNLAYLLMSSGKLEEAAEHYRAAIAIRPDHRGAHFNLGRILVHQGKLQEAIKEFLQTLEPDDDEAPRCTYALAAAYARAGNRELALKYMREARRKASERNQTELIAAIDRDLRSLEK